MIRKSENIRAIADIWLRVSLCAHDFIDGSYWKSNYKPMCEMYLPASENYEFIDGDGTVAGFISLSGNHIEALFVDMPFQSRGIGKSLIDFVKAEYFACGTGRGAITVSVYKENTKAAGFYIANGFKAAGEGVDKNTGHEELYLEFR